MTYQSVLGAAPWQQATRSRPPAGEKARNRGPVVHRIETYVCGNDHRTVLTFASTALTPDTWDCPKCSRPAALLGEHGVTQVPVERKLKEHVEQLYERRTTSELEAMLAERLDALRAGTLQGVDDYLGRTPHMYGA